MEIHDEVQLISDGSGLAVIGDPTAVEQFLATEGLASTELGLDRLLPSLATVAGAVQAAADLSAQSGRWVQVTKHSAEQIKRYGLMKSSTSGLSLGVVQSKGGEIKGIVQFAKGPGALAANPAVLAGAAGIMAQFVMQQAMDEITDYLAVIDQKVDALLRGQKDGVLADMIGVDLVIEEAMTIREHVGGVSDVTWSKVQATSLTIARTQVYVLRQLDALAEKLEKSPDVGDLASAAPEVERSVREWFAVLAHCFRLQDGLAVLELDRMLGAALDELDRHRVGLRIARDNRLALISRTTERLMARLDAAATTANAKVLRHPSKSRVVVHARNEVSGTVTDFHGRLGIELGREAVEARRWLEAASDVKDRVVETGLEGVGAARHGVGVARQVGGETVDRARGVASRVSADVARRAGRRGRDGD